jgi:transcription antitermination factor NusG
MSSEATTADASADSKEEWFALYVKLRYEHFVADYLQAKGYEAFSLTYRKLRRWRDRVQEADIPLFPGYVFGRFDPRHRLPILTTPGVREVVGYGRIPVPISEREIHAIRGAVDSLLKVEPCTYIEAGTRVRIVRGPLAGVEGILEQVRSSYRLIVSVSLIQRSIRVEVGPDMIAPESLLLGDSEARPHTKLVQSRY